MRRISIIAGSVVAALATGGVLAVSGGAQDPDGQKLQLVTKNFRFKAIDVPPRRPGREPSGSGDNFVISAVVTNRAGARRGSFDAKCTVTRGGRNGRSLCEGVYALTEGQIFLKTRFVNSNDGDISGAITGGTRAYAGARGTLTSVDRRGEAGGDPSDDTLTLLP
ncbi:MAG: hypothetical protein H0T43_06155 [Solirubrobacterales bacterium]|nr:hypothetical protein [Solirubrobacterales bacterium]